MSLYMDCNYFLQHIHDIVDLVSRSCIKPVVYCICKDCIYIQETCNVDDKLEKGMYQNNQYTTDWDII